MPTPPATVRLRNAFTITSRRGADGREHHLITAPKHGPDRSQARRAIMAVLHRAEQHHHRISFLLTLGDYTQHELNARRGYEADLVMLQCRIEHDDPYAWLQRQLLPGHQKNDANSIIGVSIVTWPQPSAPPLGHQGV